MAALALSNGRDVEYAAALALGLSGGSSRSEALAGDLEKRFPGRYFRQIYLRTGMLEMLTEIQAQLVSLGRRDREPAMQNFDNPVPKVILRDLIARQFAMQMFRKESLALTAHK